MLGSASQRGVTTEEDVWPGPLSVMPVTRGGGGGGMVMVGLCRPVV